MSDEHIPQEQSAQQSTTKQSTTKKASKKSAKKKASKKSSKAKTADIKRVARPYPASSFEDALHLPEAIFKHAQGQRVRRLTLLKLMDRSPTSGPTRAMITNSGKYDLTTGSYNAEWLELTELGKLASNPFEEPKTKLEARMHLAIENVPPFNYLYNEYKGKKIPTHEVLKDVLAEGNFNVSNLSECIDLFIVNAKFLGLLQTFAGAETLLPFEQVLDELHLTTEETEVVTSPISVVSGGTVTTTPDKSVTSPRVNWSKTCFVISPIGSDGSEQRQHADLFLGSLIEPSMREFNLDVVRADAIGAPGMITSQIIEYLLRSRLAIVDLSFHNPNAFYEMAIRHASRLPIVQITRKLDRLPFDVNQVRTVIIDTTDIYSLVPKLETYRSEIAQQVRAALADSGSASNPLTTFFPGFSMTIPKEK